MHFSSFVLLSLSLILLDCCRPTAATTLRSINRIEDRISCPASVPSWLPPGLPEYPSLLHMCARILQYPRNMACQCVGVELLCGSSSEVVIQNYLVHYCLVWCHCGPGTRKNHVQSTTNLIFPGVVGQVTKPPPIHTCSGTCTSVDHGCSRASNRDCQCFAPPVSPFFWHIGDCGTRLPFKAKRDLAQQRHSHYLNATAKLASSSKATASPGPLPDLAAQLASGLLPSPCNASYISFACADSTDGIVHEPPQNWLGALLPEGATAQKPLPPVPERFLRIHGREKGEVQLQMAVE